MLDRTTLELTMLEIVRQSGEQLDNHTRYTIRNGLAQALQAKERQAQDERTSLPVEEARRAAQINQSYDCSAADSFSALRP
ncbi:hypothetical protein [Klebsiella michiganensis]|uniref:hypothetical protein n=1 Tax=Klebsiella michiganensis TaxID=1134687 RepID=UPI001CCC9A65|nr:hypothetical protein [Klebsiella michiganensis]